MVASATCEKRPSTTHHRNHPTGEDGEDGRGRVILLGDPAPLPSPNLPRPPPTFGAVAPSIPMANRNLPQPASLLGIPVALTSRARAYTTRDASAPVSASSAARTSGGTPRRAVRSARAASRPRPQLTPQAPTG